MTGVKAKASVKERRIKDRIRSIPPVVWMLLLMMVVFSLTNRSYFSLQNFVNILRQSVPLMILAFAQTLIVLTQGTDLSLGAQVSLVTVIWVYLCRLNVPVGLAAVAAVLTSMLAGAINGVLVSKGKIPPFIATFGMQNILNSISLTLTAGSSIYFSSDLFYRLYESRVIGIPGPVLVAVAVFALTWLLLYRTKFGTNIFALGGNQEAMTLAGIDTSCAYIKTYMFAGFLAGISGLITACRVESGQPIVGSGWEFEAVAATLLGGTSLREGKGGIVGTVFGVLMLTSLRNGLNISGVSAMYQNAIIGAIVMLAIVVDAMIRRSQEG